MAGIDLHAHTLASDGTSTPAELMLHAADCGLEVVAITDHDTTSGWAEAARHLPSSLQLVRGAELSCSFAGVSLHLLAYLFDPEHPPLVRALADLRESRLGRAERIVQALVADGHAVTWGAVQGLAGGTVGRPHIARALMDVGLVESVGEAFGQDWIGTGGRYWAEHEVLPALTAIALVRDAGGVVVFAHPGATARGRTVDDEVIEQFAAAGLAGLEVDHPDHDAPTRNRLQQLARALDLIPTGASDFHGTNKHVALGSASTGRAAYEDLMSRATGVEVL